MVRTSEPASRFVLALVLCLSCRQCRNTTTFALSSASPYGATTKNVATQILQGAGPATVDMNNYNLPLGEIELEWKANMVQKTNEQQTFCALSSRSSQNFVDTFQVSFPRINGQGLGLGLVELAGGREDGLGITVVSSVLAGGAAAAATATAGMDILPGDSLGQVRIVRRTRVKDVSEQVQEFIAQTECLSYDATVEAIASLPPHSTSTSNSDDLEDTFLLEIKRLRRKPKVSIKLQYPPSQNEKDVTLELFAGENLRQGMLLRGVKLNDPLAKRFDTKPSGGNCGAGGLCRTCSVTVQNGKDLLNPQRPAEKKMLEDNPRWRLACKAIVGYGMAEGEMTIRVNPRQWNS
jgi:ferredoxin